jgi:uncharacterized protein (TIGR03437 family)
MIRISTALILVASTGLAENRPRFAFTQFPAAVSAVAQDAQGDTYFTGNVLGSPFAATQGAYQSKNGGATCIGGSGGLAPPMPMPCDNAFVIKLDQFGTLIFATYLGGTGGVNATAISVDSQGNVYVSGSFQNVFPVTPGAAFTNPTKGGTDGFVAKLNASGTQLMYSTLIPAVQVASTAVDAAGNLYFTGVWVSLISGHFPATPGAYQSTPANSVGAAVIGKLNASGSALIYGTYLSGTLGPSAGVAIAVDAAGNTIVSGTNEAPDFPASAGNFSNSLPGHQNTYLTKLSPDGTRLIYSTLLGPLQVSGMKVDVSGGIHLYGFAQSSFPVTASAFGATPASGDGGFLLDVSADGQSVVSSIYVPASVPPTAANMDIDSTGNTYVVGYGSVQTTVGAFQPSGSGGAFVAKITPSGQILGATYLAEPASSPYFEAIAAERDGSVVVATTGTDSLIVANLFPALTLENAASSVANTAVPGELVSIRGYGLGPEVGLSSSPTTNLGGVQVYFDNFAAPIIYAQGEQINAQVPWEIAGQAVTQLRIVYNVADVGGVAVPVAQALPGVFYIENSDGSLNSPSNPAHAGDYIAIYGTGGGTMNPPGATGNPWPLSPLSTLTQSVSVIVGSEAGEVLYDGSAPTLESAFFQIDVRLPPDLTSAAQSLSVTIGGVTSVPLAMSIQ